MFKLNERGVIHFVVLFILLAGIVAGLYLVQHTQIFQPKAGGNITRVEIVDDKGNPIPTTNTTKVKLKVTWVEGTGWGGVRLGSGQGNAVAGVSTTKLLAQASTGRISASAVTIPAGQTNGVTRITVDQMQNFGSNALICVVSDAPNASLVTFAAPGSSGSWSGNTAASYEGTTGAWIAPGRRYTFNLYSWNSGTANHSDCTGTPVSSVVVDGPGGDTPTQTFPQSFRVANSEKELFSAPEYAFTGNPTTIDWILDSGAGVKIVYAQFRLEEVWGGMVKSSIELIGPPPPFEVILSANPTTVTSGQQTTLSWTIMGAVTSCDLSLGVSEDVSARGGQQSPIVTSGSKTITLTNSTSRPLTQTFTLGCSDGNGNGAQSSADVKVLPVLTECTVPQFVRSFNSYFGDSRYTSICDFNKDEAINLTDIYYLLNQQPHI